MTRTARAVILLIALVALGLPVTAAAQEPLPPAASTHARARNGEATTLALENARLYVPPGAVAPDAVIAFGVGGVPSPEGVVLRSGVVVSAAGGLHAPVAVLIAPTALDRASFDVATPALRDTADGAFHPCAADSAWIVCPVPHAGAYVLDATTEPPSNDPLVRAALAGVRQSVDEGSGLMSRILIVAGAAIAGGALAWWLGRPRDSKRTDEAAH